MSVPPVKPQHSDKVEVKKSTYTMMLLATILFVGATVAAVVLGIQLNNKSSDPESAPKPEPEPTESIAIAGTWGDGFGSLIVIDDNAYTSRYPADGEPAFINFTFYNNVLGFAVGQNSGPGSYNPGKWSRIDFHEITDANKWGPANVGKFAYCSTLYNAETETAAMLLNTQPGGGVSPAIYDFALANTTGCGGFPFSILQDPPA